MDGHPVIDIGSLDGPLKHKIEQLQHLFHVKYECPPVFVARVPGRVNLIGEHIDYCGYAVFPMAIDQEILVAWCPTEDNNLVLTNTNPTYDSYSCSVSDFSIDKGVPHWFKYFLCGIKGVMESPKSSSVEWKGAKVLVSGYIPPSAGLSSSSALVCSAAVFMSTAHNIKFGRRELADLCAHSECYIGTEGGGMDQAIAFLASRGTAKLIEFNPLRAHDTKLPEGAVFVIANSLAEANKAAGSEFNCRVMECRLAAKILAKMHGVNPDSILRLADLQKSLGKTLPEMAEIANLYLHWEPYTKEEVAKLLGMTEAQLDASVLSENTRSVQSFKLQQRARHVFEEAHRVWRFKEICDSCSGDSALRELGQLMSASHTSCRDLYECSHPQLDRLVATAADHCLGARLTGAGWGGCMVAMVSSSGVENFIQLLKDHFYRDIPAASGLDLDTVLFPTQPGDGAAVFQ